MRPILLLLLPALLAAQPLRLRVVESSGPAHVVGSRTASPLVVEVVDDRGVPVSGATVSFRLPASGPGGVFPSGLSTEVAVTGADGRAAAPAIRWNQTPGEFQIGVTAGKGDSRASLASARRLLPSAAGAPAASSGRSRRKLLLVIAGVAAGSAAAGLAVTRRNPASSAPQSSVPALSVGIPTITVGGP
ncbi:MAG: hypothetical protein IT159_16050 [Bryobacterales bacterium]|jgi:hypothetical protein|nr:hypothetical protein [Bryobacterales bacterium]